MEIDRNVNCYCSQYNSILKGKKGMLQVKIKNATGKILFHVTFALKETQVLNSKCKLQISSFVSLMTVCYNFYGKKEIHTTDLFPLSICA